MSDETTRPDDATPSSTAPSADTRSEAAASPAPLEEQVVAAIKTIYDPEIPVNIYELGLIYKLTADEATGNVEVEMTLTSPACPVAGTLPGEVETKIKEIEAVNEVSVELVWDPPWSKDLLSEAAKLTLGIG